jgi:hypothetical protein
MCVVVGREGGREGGRKGGREGGREGEKGKREEGKEREEGRRERVCVCVIAVVSPCGLVYSSPDTAVCV